MAEPDPPPPTISAAFPAPPPFYNSFTPDNISQLQQHLSSAIPDSSKPYSPSAPTSAPIPDIFSLPPELRNLIPPPLPPDSKYRSFGTLHDTTPAPPTLPSLTPKETQSRLLTLTRSLLLHFLSITHILSIDPSPTLYGPKWDELKAAFTEIHDMINAYRPHQARETVIVMMEEQIARLRGEIKGVRESVERARGVVEGLAREGEGLGVDVNGEGERMVERGEKRLWEVIGREVGRV